MNKSAKMHNACNQSNNMALDLSIFGYSSRLYEPQSEDLAEKIGGSHHLIAWNGDENIKIDRLSDG